MPTACALLFHLVPVVHADIAYEECLHTQIVYLPKGKNSGGEDVPHPRDRCERKQVCVFFADVFNS